MQRFTDCVLTRSGAAVAGASVLVKTYPGDATATIYSDDGVTEQSNPMTSDANGKFSFYAADGRYTLVISKTGYITQQTLTDHVLLQDLEDADPDHASAADIHFTPSGIGGSSTDVQTQLRKAEFFDTVSDLKAWSAPTNEVLAFVRETDTGEGGPAWYRWNSSDTSADNGGAVIQPTAAPATGRWNIVTAPREPEFRPRLKAVFDKMFTAYSGTASRVVGVSFGDSVSSHPWLYIAPFIHNAMGPRTNAGWETDGNIGLGSYAGADSTTSVISGSAISALTSQWSYFPTGAISSAPLSCSFKFLTGGANPTFTDLKFFYFKEVGGQSAVPFYVGGVQVGTIDMSLASGGPTLATFTYNQARAQAEVRIDVPASGSAVKFLSCHFIDGDSNGLDYYPCGQGGISLQDAMGTNSSTSQGRTNLQTWLTDISADIFTFQMKEDSSYLLAELVKLGDVIDAAIPNADKVFFGSTPMSDTTSDADQRVQNEIIRKFCAARGYIYFDLYAPFVVGGDPTTAYANLDALGWEGDGTHPSSEARSFTGYLFCQEIGIDSIGYGFTPKAVRDRSNASYLANNTSIGAADGQDISFSTNDSIGRDWRISVVRKLTLGLDDGTTDLLTLNSQTSTATFGTHIALATDNTYDIGNSTTAAKDIYASGSFRAGDGTAAAPSIRLKNVASGLFRHGSVNTNISFAANGTHVARLDPSGNLVVTGGIFLGGSGAGLVTVDANLTRDAANVIAQKNSTTAQEFRIYGSTTGTKYLQLKHDGTDAIVDTSASAGKLKLAPSNASDIQWGKALVALGGGSAPTLGTIGGSGPATAAQNSWLRVLDSTGAACWIPVWK